MGYDSCDKLENEKVPNKNCCKAYFRFPHHVRVMRKDKGLQNYSLLNYWNLFQLWDDEKMFDTVIG